MDDRDTARSVGRARLIGAIALVGCAALCSACLRPNAQDDQRNTNGPGTQGQMPHNTSGPGVKNTAGAGYYGSQSWGPPGPSDGARGPVGESHAATGFATDQPGSTNALPGSGNNGWGGAASPSRGVTGNGIGPWTQ
jgi:hypothetical protein